MRNNSEEKMRNSKSNNKNKITVVILSTIIILCIAIILYLLFVYKPKNLDYAPGVIDKNAVYSGDNSNKMDKSEGGGAVSLSYKKEVTVDLKYKTVNMTFKNPSRSTQTMVIQVIVTINDEDIVIAQSDRVPPGYTIEKLDLVNSEKLNNKEVKGLFNIMYYDEETDEKSIVNTNIPINIAIVK